MESLDPRVIMWAAAATGLTKAIVDGIKMAIPDRPQWLPVLLAFLLGPVFLILLMVSQSAPMTAAAIANGIVGGIMAGAGAVGLTTLSNKSRREPDSTVETEPEPERLGLGRPDR